jgi:hypothetical protein
LKKIGFRLKTLSPTPFHKRFAPLQRQAWRSGKLKSRGKRRREKKKKIESRFAPSHGREVVVDTKKRSGKRDAPPMAVSEWYNSWFRGYYVRWICVWLLGWVERAVLLKNAWV